MAQLKPYFSTGELAAALAVSLSGFAAHTAKDQRPRRQADRQLLRCIGPLFVASRKTYGSPRLQVALRSLGWRCGKNRIARLMRQKGLRARQKRRFRPLTTQSNPRRTPAPNRLQQVSRPTGPNQIWVSDITYIPSSQGWLYLAAILDAYSRKCVGWSLGESLNTDLVTEAWEQAQRQRRPSPGLLHHSDRGLQYTSSRYQRLLHKSQAVQSMSRSGNPYDNALMESFFATLKTECFGFHPQTLSKAQIRLRIFDYIETFYNPKRLHSALDYRSPVEFEKLHH
jgi:putative transposase